MLDCLAEGYNQLAILALANGVNIRSWSAGHRRLGLFAHHDQVIALEAVVSFFEVKSCWAVADVGAQSLVGCIHAKHRKLAKIPIAISRGVVYPVLRLRIRGTLFGYKQQVEPAVKIDILSTEKKGLILGERCHRGNVQLLHGLAASLEDNGFHHTALRNRLQFEAKVGGTRPAAKDDGARIAALDILLPGCGTAARVCSARRTAASG